MLREASPQNPATAGAAFASLADREAELEPIARFHFAGHRDPDGTAMTSAIGWAASKPAIRVKPFPWLLMRGVAPFNETVRELMEMKPLWRPPVQLGNARLASLLGAEPRTPLDEAVVTTLKGLGSIR